MRSILGPAPVLDFDGTLARLPLDWAGVRRDLGVATVEELWARGDAAAWERLAAAEVAAAAVAEPVGALLAALGASRELAVLTGNSERAVARFLARFPALAARCRHVEGRESLGGPKRDPRRFAAALRRCAAATSAARGAAPLVYTGDAAWELELARGCGAVAVDAAVFTRRGPGNPEGVPRRIGGDLGLPPGNHGEAGG